MNRKPHNKIAVTTTRQPAGKATKNAAPKARKPNPRKLQEVEAPQDSTPELPPYMNSTVQRHDCTGYCVVFLDAYPEQASDPTFLQRFQDAMHAIAFRLCVSAETDMFDLELRPFVIGRAAGEQGAETPTPTPTPADPDQDGEATSAPS